MPQVVLLRGVNVGGHRTFRPSLLAKQLEHLDVVNIGAAGTFVVRGSIGAEKLRTEILRRMPFDADVMICDGRDVLALASRDPFAGQPSHRDIMRFVTVLAAGRCAAVRVPLSLPSSGRWGLKVLERQDRFVVGLYRREMKAIRYLGELEKVFGLAGTTRNWNTFQAIARALREGALAG
jgi:uncharacterized protein (DUF1697 family)